MKLTNGKLISRFAKSARRALPAFCISLAICSLSLFLYIYLYWLYWGTRPAPLFQFLANTELTTLDIRFLGRMELKALGIPFFSRVGRDPDKSVVIVAIDQKSQDVLGHWPFPRSYFADAVDFLRGAGARVITFDVNFPQPDKNSALNALRKVKEEYSAQPRARSNPEFEAGLDSLITQADNDKKFSDALSRYPNAILGYFFLTNEEVTAAQNPELAGEFVKYLSFQAYPQIIHREYGTKFECPVYPALSPNLKDFALYAKNFGFINVIPDPDGMVRRVPVVARFQGNYYPSLDVASALAYMDVSLDQVALIFDQNGLVGVDLGKDKISTDPGGYVQVNYHGEAGTYPHYSLADVVKRKLPAEFFRDKLVLIGPTALGIGDFVPTPVQTLNFPGVEVHANVIDNILNGEFIRRGLDENLGDMGFILLFSLGAGILFGVVTPVRATVFGLFSLIAYVFLAFYFFAYHRVWIVVVIPTATLITTYGAIISYRFFFEEKEKRKVQNVFQQYMAPSLINQLLENPEQVHLGGEEKELSVMFADIRGFTSISEGLSPTQLVELLGDYLSEMTDTIFKNWGTLDKYIGDAILAFWGAPYPQPDHAERACRTALQMLDALKKMQTVWAAQGRPHIDIGMGMNSGPVLVGNMGSRLRFNYTVMGDNVNLASRLEGLNKAFSTRLIISESTYEQVQRKFVARELDFIRVKGKKKPVRIHELLGPIEASDQYRDLVERFGRGLQEYRSGQWESAIDVFGELRRDYPEDGPSAVFLGRCRDYFAEPPQGTWDGVHVMETK
jgi:adenylate cyclase